MNKMNENAKSVLAERKRRILSIINEGIRGFYLILLVNVLCIIVLITIMLLI